MNVWIINPYGTLPSEGWREYRSAMLARALARRGHQVRWWISDIEHRSKQRRPEGVVDPLLPEQVTVHVVPSKGYRRNISIGRIRYELSFAAGFNATSRSLPPPDLIVLADPSLFFAGPVAAYARRHGIPFVLDVLDLWPELFHILLPRWARRFGQQVFAVLYWRRDRLVGQAAAVVAVTADYLAETTRRVKPAMADIVYLGVDSGAFRPPSVLARDDHGVLELIYAGTLGDAYDMPVILETIEHLASDARPVRFTIAGDGPWRERIARLAERFPRHVCFLGRVSAAALPDHYGKAHAGLATYAPGSTVSMPVKLFDYMASGLATIGSMGGEAGVLLEQGAGRAYRAGSAESLMDVIEHYLAHPASLDKARRFAFNASRQFDQAVQHMRFARLLEEVLKRRAARC